MNDFHIYIYTLSICKINILVYSVTVLGLDPNLQDQLSWCSGLLTSLKAVFIFLTSQCSVVSAAANVQIYSPVATC